MTSLRPFRRLPRALRAPLALLPLLGPIVPAALSFAPPALVASSTTSVVCAQDEPSGEPSDKPSGEPSGATDEHAERERAFEAMLENASLTGRFTILGRQGEPQQETYRIGRVEKLRREDEWLVEAEIAYGGKQPVRVPVAVRVAWAGDTPMIQITDLMIPGMGKFTARVGFYDDLYFGMWSGTDHGGHMFGRVERGGASGAGASGAGERAAGDGAEQGRAKDASAAQRETAAGGGRPEDRDPENALWANWRGPLYTGEAPNASPPLRWSEDENVAWKVDLPGLGHGTPVVWGDRMFLTVAVETDEQAEAPAGRESRGRRRGRRRERITNLYEFRVLAFDRHSGEQLWDTLVVEAVPHESLHSTASQASNSAITDGEFVYAHFGSRGLHALTLDGELVWSVDLPRMQTRNDFGEGSSPALWGDTIVVNMDHEGQSFILALDRRTGEQKWRRERDEPTSWSTPLIVDANGGPQVVVSATNATRGYDLETGEVVWSLGGLSFNVIPTPVPVAADDAVIVMSNFRGNAMQKIAVEGAAGDLSDNEHVLWQFTTGNTPYVPSGLVYDGYLYMLRSLAGVLSCADLETGEFVYSGERLPGIREQIYASPLGADGRVYIVSRGGNTAVVRAGPDFEVLAVNELDDTFNASPVAIGNDLYLRGDDALYCLRADD